jgi:hypothetical protein
MKTTLTALALAAMLATSAHAGGPVIVADAAVENTGPTTEDGSLPGWIVPVGIGLMILVAIAGGSDDLCNGPDDVPVPTPGGC